MAFVRRSIGQITRMYTGNQVPRNSIQAFSRERAGWLSTLSLSEDILAFPPTGFVKRRYARFRESGQNYSLSLPTGTEGRGEDNEKRAGTTTELSLPRDTQGRIL
ncbi:uncharacterized protein BO96DRAFT_68371 [Aspergillus niger CBS 101883]|uniref:uncharacterized protein n=1 Tax=Aspergillus lacticoffeatus (strain CBS 101883) TaxID=1450533 RepID=UPI000D7F22C2|nr:uncharacterized protein BO96DRAFT_68371 [Aspergillus niger CBS 101883]PYH55887.1 hypothetical protein BO96DRAFT_68371 [Aspergillus niger CBS 101883]